MWGQTIAERKYLLSLLDQRQVSPQLLSRLSALGHIEPGARSVVVLVPHDYGPWNW